MLPRPITVALTLLISLVWVGNVVVGFIDPQRHDPTINAIFAVVVGAIFALGRKDESVSAARRRLGRFISGENAEPRERDEAEEIDP